MHLLLGDPQDPCCLSVRDALVARNCPSRIVANPVVDPARFAWRLDNEQSVSQLVWDDGPPLPDDHIAGVLVRHAGWLDPEGWATDDLAYMQSEIQAALLAWLWSLRCPVVNRYPPAIWYRPRTSVLTWQPLLRRCGLPVLETVITNVEEEARAFAQRQADDGVSGAVYGPLTSDVRYLVSREEDWNGLAALQRVAPVCLSVPHEEARSVCVVGKRIIWDGEPVPDRISWEPLLQRFAAAAGLDFVELVLAPVSAGICVIAVEPQPRYDCFGYEAQQEILDGILHLLTAGTGVSSKSTAQSMQRATP